MFVVLIGFTDSPDVCCVGSLHNIDTNMFDSRARARACVSVCVRARACVRACEGQYHKTLWTNDNR